MVSKPLATEDLVHVLAHAGDAFAMLANQRVFITGGTGFFGHWLLESLLYANAALLLDLHATVLTRDAQRFRANSPHIAKDPAITLLEGDSQTFAFPREPHTHILHAATDSGGQQTHLPPNALADSILSGTKRVLQFAEATAAERLLYVSTGAVYGRSTTLLKTPETYLETAHPRLPPGSYEEAKRRAELLCLDHPGLKRSLRNSSFEGARLQPCHHSCNTNVALATEGQFFQSGRVSQHPLQPVIARCFAFVGPHLPLDQHFAIGNFIGAALADKPIHITGDGSPRRSWLYMADLAIWLWTLLASGQPGRAYNVGSDQSYSIAEAAHLTAATLRPAHGGGSTIEVQIDGKPDPYAPLNSYVPDISRAQTERNLRITIALDEALRRTAAWHGPIPISQPH